MGWHGDPQLRDLHLGCQMDAHDSERFVLESTEYQPALDCAVDVVVLNTGVVRENADNLVYGNHGHLRPVKDARACRSLSYGGLWSVVFRVETRGFCGRCGAIGLVGGA